MKIGIAFIVHSNHLCRVPSCRAAVGFDCVPDSRLVELRLEVEVEPVPFSLIIFLTNVPKSSQFEPFALMAPMPP